jgi:hypothetical protein
MATSITIKRLTNTGGIYRTRESGATVDNVWVVQDSEGVKLEIMDRKAPYVARYGGIIPGSDLTSRLNAIYADADVNEVVFDNGSITVNGTLTIPANKKITFRANGRLVGTGTINGGIIHAETNQHIFATTLTVNPQAVANSSNNFSVKWFGAKGDASVDDQPFIQKTIDTVAANQDKIKTVYIPSGNYILYAPLIIYKWNGTRYLQVTINLKGEKVHAGQATAGTRLLFSNNNLFCIGIQQGKRTTIEYLEISGEFNPTFSSDFDFYSRSLAAYTDGTRRDNRFSPHCGVAIDPFGNRPSAGQIWAGNEYPGYTSWYRGDVSVDAQAGSTGTLIKELYIAGFVVGVGHSFNGVTKNAEMTQVIDCQINTVKVAVSNGQDQEKCNQVINLMCWNRVHTVFAAGLYGNQIPGNWYIEKVNLAGTVQQIFYFNGGGYYPTYAKEIFAERTGRVGYLGTKLKCHISDSVLDFAVPEYAGGYYQYVIDGDFTTYRNCALRYYGSAYGTPIAIRGKSYFDNCAFAVAPFVCDPEMMNSPVGTTISEQTGLSVFTNCTVDQLVLGDSQECVMQISDMDNWMVYGDKKYRLLNSEWSQNESIQHVIEGGYKIGDIYWARLFNDPNLCVINIGGDANRTSVINVGSAYINRFVAFSLIVTEGGLIVGYCTGVDTLTNQITVFFTGPDIVSGNSYSLGCYYPRYNLGSFIGDTTIGSNQITNVVFDTIGPNGSAIAGTLIETPIFHNFSLTGKYQRLAKIISYNSGTRTITLDQNYGMTSQGAYFGLGKRKKIVYGTNDIGGIADATILTAGSMAYVTVAPSGIERTYIVRKTGFADAAGIGGGETRQALWYEVGTAGSNRDEFSLSADGTRSVPSDRILTKILVLPTVNLAAFKIGTTAGGEELMTTAPVPSSDWTIVDVSKYFPSGGTIYFTGITTITQIKFVYE